MRSLILALAATTAAATLAAQTVDPGMTREQVVAKLGEPLSTHSYQGHSYLMYKNGCEKTCGMNDVVVLDSGKVVDAVFRAPTRKYSGTSSSPRMISAADARPGPDAAPAPLAIPRAPAKHVAPAPVKKPASAPAKPGTPAKVAPTPAPKTIPPSTAKTVAPPAKKPPTSAASPAKKPVPDSAKKPAAAATPVKKPS